MLVLGLVVWGIIAVHDRSEEAANQPLATLKRWPEVHALADTKFQLQTVWRTGSIFYQFEVQGYPVVLRQARERDSQAALTIDFLDKDGFRLFEHQLALTGMTGTMGEDGQPTGLSWKGDEFLNVDLYRRAARWELSSSGFSPAPAPALDVVVPPSGPLGKPLLQPKPSVIPSPKPKWRDVSIWRNLSHGISQNDVKRLLGEPEKVSDLGFQVTWYYGYPMGGEVTFGQEGTVKSWSEP